MYEAHFDLSRRPFLSVAQADGYYPAEPIEIARQDLGRCIARGEGIGILIGPTGTGKTLLCRKLAAEFEYSFNVVLLASGRMATRRTLLQAILHGLGRPYRGMDEGELRLALSDDLSSEERLPDGLLLIVDEAHGLPLRLIDELRMLTNLAAEGYPRVRLILAGGPALEERLTAPKLDSFSQRIITRCYLESFDRAETGQYIRSQIAAAEADGEAIFPDDACQAVYQATDGVPRLVNQLCDHALMSAFSGGARTIDRRCIEEAWANLQQLPSPWNGDSDEVENNVIEFGGLDDETNAGAPVDQVEQPDEDDFVMSVPTLRITPDEHQMGDEPAEVSAAAEDVVSQPDVLFRPAGTIGPHVELVLHDAHDPFGEDFEKEEVVVDRYAACQPAEPSPQTLEFAEPIDSAEADVRGEPIMAETETPLSSPAECDPGPADDRDIIILEDDNRVFEIEPGHSAVAVHRQQFDRLFARLRRSS